MYVRRPASPRETNNGARHAFAMRPMNVALRRDGLRRSKWGLRCDGSHTCMLGAWMPFRQANAR